MMGGFSKKVGVSERCTVMKAGIPQTPTIKSVSIAQKRPWAYRRIKYGAKHRGAYLELSTRVPCIQSIHPLSQRIFIFGFMRCTMQSSLSKCSRCKCAIDSVLHGPVELTPREKGSNRQVIPYSDCRSCAAKKEYLI